MLQLPCIPPVNHLHQSLLKLYPSIKKAKNKINWKPKISFEKGLRSTIKYYNEQAI